MSVLIRPADYCAFNTGEDAMEALRNAPFSDEKRRSISRRAEDRGNVAQALVTDEFTANDLFLTEYCATIAYELRRRHTQ